MKEKKEEWIKPQLIVLGRGTPEENVLAGCKVNIKINGPNSKKTGCFKKGKCNNKCSKSSTS